MEDRLPLVAEAAGAVRHHALALGRADGGAQIGLARQAASALAAFRRVERDHMVARLHNGDARPPIGRTSCRERVCQYVYISVYAVPLKKNEIGNKHDRNK